jgi:Protein of unknown function (DUF2806)
MLARATAQAKIETKAILALDPSSEAVAEEVPILKRAMERLTIQEVRRQENLEAVIGIAATNLPSEIPDEPIDETWLTRFLSAAGDVSQENMRAIWGRVLANETAHPGRYSLRALETLRTLSSREAKKFEIVASFLILGFVFKLDQDFLMELGLSWGDIMLLRAIGLVSQTDLYTRFDTPQILDYHGHTMLVERLQKEGSASTPMQAGQFGVYVLTPLGDELSSLPETLPNWRYIQALATWLREGSVSLKMAHGYQGGLSFERLEEIPPPEVNPDWALHMDVSDPPNPDCSGRHFGG